MEIYDWNNNAANNNAAPPNGWPENMQYSQVNDVGRANMAVVARFIQAIGAVTTTGAANAYVLTVSQAVTALANGMLFAFKADKTNTGAATLKVNALAAVALRDNRGAALAAGDIQTNGLYMVQFDGSVFRLVGQESAATTRAKTAAANDSNVYDDAAVAKLAGIEANAAADQSGAEIKALYEAEANTNAFTDASVSKLAGIEAGATADQSGAEIKAAYEAQANTNAFTDAEQVKLAGVEAGATADQSAAEIRTLVESATDSNVFTDADHSKLNGVEAGATADQSNSEIKSAYEANANTNAYTDAEKSKLAGVEAGATAEVAASESVAGIVEIATQTEANSGADNSRAVTPAKLAGLAFVPGLLEAHKEADTGRSSTTTPINDPDLSLSYLANVWYEFEAYLVLHSASATPGFKWAWTLTGGGTVDGQLTALLVEDDAGWGSRNHRADDVTATPATALNASNNQFLHLKGHLKRNVAGTITLAWSQLVSNATATTVRDGSWMRLVPGA